MTFKLPDGIEAKSSHHGDPHHHHHRPRITVGIFKAKVIHCSSLFLSSIATAPRKSVVALV